MMKVTFREDSFGWELQGRLVCGEAGCQEVQQELTKSATYEGVAIGCSEWQCARKQE